MPGPVFLPSLAPGDRVEDTLLVWDVDQRTRADGSPYAVLELANSTGRAATAPFWSEDLHRIDGLARGSLVSVVAEAQAWRGGTQLKVLSIRSLPPEAAALERLLPSIGDVAPWWARLDRWRGEMAAGPWRRAVDAFYGDEDFRRRYERCPASTSNHHAALGGLLRHTVEVGFIAHAITRASSAEWDLVLAGVLLHDIGKLESYRWDGVFQPTEAGALLGHVALGALMLDRRLAETSPPLTDRETWLLQHLMLSHHGALEYGSPVVPMTLEAEVLHLADHASAVTTNFQDALAEASNFEAGGTVSKRLWQLDNRRIYRPPDRR
jgi:3'-5' exoribonuclease